LAGWAKPFVQQSHSQDESIAWQQLSLNFMVAIFLFGCTHRPMFMELTRSGGLAYAQLAESLRDEQGMPRQRTIATLGRVDENGGQVVDALLCAKGNTVEVGTRRSTLQKVLARYPHISRLIVVVDRGLLAADNIAAVCAPKVAGGNQALASLVGRACPREGGRFGASGVPSRAWHSVRCQCLTQHRSGLESDPRGNIAVTCFSVYSRSAEGSNVPPRTGDDYPAPPRAVHVPRHGQPVWANRCSGFVSFVHFWVKRSARNSGPPLFAEKFYANYHGF
jgi:hypothetical protein